MGAEARGGASFQGSRTESESAAKVWSGFLESRWVGRKRLSVSFPRKHHSCCLNVWQNLKKSSRVDWLAVQFVHLTATAFSQRRIVMTLQPVFWAHWWDLGIWTCAKQRLWMDTDMKAGDHSPHRSLCLHSTVSVLNTARAWRTVPLWFVASSGELSACGSAFLVVVKLWLPLALVWTSFVLQHVAAPTLPSSHRTSDTRGTLEMLLRLLAIPQVNSAPPVGHIRGGWWKNLRQSWDSFLAHRQTVTRTFLTQNKMWIQPKHTDWLSQNIFLCSLSVNTVNLLSSFRTLGFHFTSSSHVQIFNAVHSTASEGHHRANG